jgi:hypothetical protein
LIFYFLKPGSMAVPLFSVKDEVTHCLGLSDLGKHAAYATVIAGGFYLCGAGLPMIAAAGTFLFTQDL